MQARRAERELREEREKALRLERELEGWKAVRGAGLGRSGTMAQLSEMGSRRGSAEIRRAPSNSKGFL